MPHSPFYDSYASFKRYTTPQSGRKQAARFDRLIWQPGACQADHSFLEIGCGTGAFLLYLSEKGCLNFHGIDLDPALADVLPVQTRDHFICGDIRAELAQRTLGPFDRIVALDVLEHFTADEARGLLLDLKPHMTLGGRVIVKVPNASSPWGLQYQNGDLTHRTAFTPSSMDQLAQSCGFKVVAVLPVREGSRRRMITDRLAHGFLSWALLTPPPIWTANFVAVLEV